MSPQKVAFYTLGCKLNFSETSSISRSLENAGFAKVPFHETADVYVINTCSVTENADKKCRKIVREALNQSPEAFIVIIGCYAQLKPEEIVNIPGVDLVLGAAEKFNLTDHLKELAKKDKGQIVSGHIKHVNIFTPSFSAGDRTRSFLKVQDGCDYFCSFCTIPLARGRSRSESIEKTIDSAKEAVSTGVREIVLTGVNIGDFGNGGEENFLGLIRELDCIEGVDRFRISSIEPNLLDLEIISFVASSKKFVPHFHIPLQSGSDKILKLMRRRYDKALYKSRIDDIKNLMPDCCIGVDVIVGFPGETETDFMETYDFLNQLDISYLHVFTYSERDNTTAIRLPDPVPQEERSKRSKMLHILSDKKRRKFYEGQLQKKHHVLFESENNDGMMGGFTENYVRVKHPYDPLLVNEILEVSLTTIGNDGDVLCEAITETVNHPSRS